MVIYLLLDIIVVEFLEVGWIRICRNSGIWGFKCKMIYIIFVVGGVNCDLFFFGILCLFFGFYEGNFIYKVFMIMVFFDFYYLFF